MRESGPPIDCTKEKLRILCFGEVLWDCLPSGRFPGGAPLNVAYHLHKLGCDALIVSAVGRDDAGDEMLAYLEKRGLSTEYIQRHPTLPTGSVDVILENGQPRYTIRENVAWDAIAPDEAVLRAAHESHAIIYGTLASRSEISRKTLGALLEIEKPMRIIDVNLRAPFDDRARALDLARKADWIKLNLHEIGQLTARTIEPGELPAAVYALNELTAGERVCITLGDNGAIAWDVFIIVHQLSPKIKVCDTVGAGDAFTAAFVVGVLTHKVNETLPAILRRANRLGSIVASLPGGQPEYTEPSEPA